MGAFSLFVPTKNLNLTFRIRLNQRIEMSKNHNCGANWVNCTLCRSGRQSVNVLNRAAERQVKWPEPKNYGQSPIQDPAVYTSLDDAFAGILSYMSSTTKSCKRFYQSRSASEKEEKDHLHCNRFHAPKYTKAQQRNPLQSAEDVHVVVHPGTYAVSAGEWGTEQQQTHVVHIEKGQNVNLDFVM